MATYYVDPAATGLNDGSSWTDAFTDLQSAADSALVAGDIVYCRGTQILTTGILVKASGNTTNSMIHYIGCNALGVDDGTRFVLDGNGVSTSCLLSDGGSYSLFKNFEIKGAVSHGVGKATADIGSPTFINCKFHSNGGVGFNSGSWQNPTFYKCSFNNNGSHGSQTNYTGLGRYLFCSFLDNASIGVYQYINAGYSCIYIGCVFSGNTNGLELQYGGWLLMNYVVDGNSAHGVETDFSDCYRGTSMIGNRITNNGGYGVYDAGIGYVMGVAAYNFFDNNASGAYPGGVNFSINSLFENGVDTNIFTGTQGYVDQANGDYNLTSDATMRRVPVTLPS